MSRIESETMSRRLPENVRERVEARLQQATMSMKIWVGEQLADREVLDAHQVVSAGRVGLRSGQVSELTVVAPLKPDGAKRLRRLFDLFDGNFAGALAVGTIHSMRFVFLDDDTRLLFTTTYDGEWDPYIDDFATKIPDLMDYIFGNVEGWPGIHSPEVKDFIAGLQVGASGWFVSHPTMTVAEGTRLLELDRHVDAFVQTLN